ncbi:MAG: hypothetical protein Fur0022_35300 [Anaerolineales bacterium]
MSLPTDISPLITDHRSPITPSERRWIFWAAVIGMLITTIPYFIGFHTQGEDWRFTGFVFGVNDGNSYIAKMLAGAEGDWLFRTPYTHLEQRGILAYFPFIVLGKLAAPPAQHEQFVILYHLYRLVGGVLAILATYEFLAFFISRISVRRLGTLVACFGGGLGWLLVILGQRNWLGSLPLDFYSPETFGFLSLYGLPHLAVSRALLLYGLLLYLRQTSPPHAAFTSIFPGLLFLLTGFFQPLTIAVAWAAIGAHLAGYGLTLFVRGHRSRTDYQLWLEYLRRAILAGLISAPFVLYSFLALRGDPFLSGWTAQNKILSPHFLHYLAAYGLMLPLVIMGARALLHTRPVQSWLLIGWGLLLPMLAYAPFNLQRRLPEGIWVALVTLAMASFDRVQKPARAAYIPLALTFPTTFFLLLGGITSTLQPQTPIFRPTSEVNAFLFLADYAQTDELALTSFETGNVLPVWAPVRVIIGHGPESVGLAELQPRVEAFYHAKTSDIERLEFLKEFEVKYVFWGPQERTLGGWDAGQAGYLKEVFNENGYTVFEIVP